VVLGMVDEVLRSTSPAIDAEALQEILDWARRQVYVVGWERDRGEYMVATQTLFLLGQLHVMVFGAPTINTPWNFVTSA